MTDKYLVLLKRGVRTFFAVIAAAFATAIGAITIELAKGHTINNLNDLGHLGLSLVPVFSIAFLGALVTAIDKGTRWQDPTQPQPIENEPTAKTSTKGSASKSSKTKSS